MNLKGRALERQIRKANKQKLVSAFGGKCIRCGFVGCSDSFDFHHINPSEKEVEIWRVIRNYDKACQEASKCIMVCSNCHREIHAKLKDYEYMRDDLLIEQESAKMQKDKPPGSVDQIELLIPPSNDAGQAPLAQQIEQPPSKRSVAGANPARGAMLLSPIG